MIAWPGACCPSSLTTFNSTSKETFMNASAAHANDDTIDAMARKISIAPDPAADFDNPGAFNQGIDAKFNNGHGVLAVRGDGGNNDVTVSRDASGTLLVNNGSVHVSGRTPTISNTQE